MDIPCCKVYRVDEDTIFSQFEYHFANEYIVHMRRLFEALEHTELPEDTMNISNLLAIRPAVPGGFHQDDSSRFCNVMQDDRHLSSIAIKINQDGESFYPLYDNGRSLFYEDNENTATRACRYDRNIRYEFDGALLVAPFR